MLNHGIAYSVNKEHYLETLNAFIEENGMRYPEAEFIEAYLGLRGMPLYTKSLGDFSEAGDG